VTNMLIQQMTTSPSSIRAFSWVIGPVKICEEFCKNMWTLQKYEGEEARCSSCWSICSVKAVKKNVSRKTFTKHQTAIGKTNEVSQSVEKWPWNSSSGEYI